MKEREALKLALDWIESTAVYIPIDLDDEGIKVSNAIKEALAQPEREPDAVVATTNEHQAIISWRGEPKPHGTNLYTTAQQRKPKFKEFIKWAGAQGYDCAQTCNSDTGEWIVLNPMTADLWKAWQAAHGIKE